MAKKQFEKEKDNIPGPINQILSLARACVYFPCCLTMDTTGSVQTATYASDSSSFLDEAVRQSSILSVDKSDKDRVVPLLWCSLAVSPCLCAFVPLCLSPWQFSRFLFVV